MKTRVIQDDSDDSTAFEDRAEAPVDQKRSINLAARIARWSAPHRKRRCSALGGRIAWTRPPQTPANGGTR